MLTPRQKNYIIKFSRKWHNINWKENFKWSAEKKQIWKNVTVPTSHVQEKVYAASASLIIKIWENCRHAISVQKMRGLTTGQLIFL